MLLGTVIPSRTISNEAKGLVLGIVGALGAGFLLIDAKLWGVVVMGGAVVILAFLPWLDQSPVKSIRYRPGSHKLVLTVFVIIFLIRVLS